MLIQPIICGSSSSSESSSTAIDRRHGASIRVAAGHCSYYYCCALCFVYSMMYVFSSVAMLHEAKVEATCLTRANFLLDRAPAASH
jgi:hypothetical protein